MSSQPKLILDAAALVSNWKTLSQMSGEGARCGAAVKADAYGLGAVETVSRLAKAGCQDFFVASWEEAEELQSCAAGSSLSVLNGILESDLDLSARIDAKPVLNSIDQAQRWRGSGRPCDVMINSGMNRLGIDVEDALAFDWSDFEIDTLMSHLASADEDVAQNSDQLERFRAAHSAVPHRRLSLANSAGIALGTEYSFDLTRPGLALYGGIPRAEFQGRIKPVGRIECEIVQTRIIAAGAHVGYNATFTAAHPMTVAIAAMGYEDGYLRSFSNRGQFLCDGITLPVIGRVSMDLVAVDISEVPLLKEGDRIGFPLDLPLQSELSGLSQYEIITGLGRRFARHWSD
ncbi:alanine racemase [Pontixanthobacter aquaemixtae]|uniref:alanine racemase n=1 Tax=Pontixanthobacter aquaemixtae TaxID=1958940 RepID=A0A844ZXN1_9SPHN|nr:alanine racemase [Pontixanthobacter aquaemixtae]MXO90249.1 alanine racemase [Pontixanthobacter aquaemixtae]